MKFIADLHIHSKYSMATSKLGDLPHLYHWARIKGIHLVGTGDFTHPQWFKELKENLEPLHNGIFQLKKEMIASVEKEFPFSTKESISPSFILSTEISNVYKKNGKVRKNHNVVLFDSFESVDKLRKQLEKIGNITYDGRPMLGLDAHDLLEIVLSISPHNMFIPAHIWTPWFSLFGSKSGFDSIDECFGDLTNHITALETGLSSDPPMNWMKSELDKFNLVSNSDAHSPQKLGREVNLFDTDLSFHSIKKSLENKQSKEFLGTLEFYPEEGKYHNDGHRNCGINISPEESIQYNNICPVCGKPLTIGVLHRVFELADRKYNEKPNNAKLFESVIPLQQILSHILNYSPTSKKLITTYEHLIHHLGSEFFILREAPIDFIQKNSNALIAEGIKRVREGKVERIPGFDGEFGQIIIFNDDEKSELANQAVLFPMNKPKIKNKKHSLEHLDPQKNAQPISTPTKTTVVSPSPSQKKILNETQFPIAVVAGPGTGKTFLLVEKIKQLKTKNISAITFTHKSADEIKTRLKTQSKFIGTIHKIGLDLLKKFHQKPFTVITPREILPLLQTNNQLRLSKKELHTLSFFKGSLINNMAVTQYTQFLEKNNLLDLDDIIIKATHILRSNKEAQQFIKNSVQYLFIDEFQDVNKSQYAFIQSFSQIIDNQIFIIGDSAQTIYQFRGSMPNIFDVFINDFSPKVFHLTDNFRSTKKIITISNALMERTISAHSTKEGDVIYKTFPTGLSESIFVAHTIGKLIGGLDMLEAHKLSKKTFYSFNDIAILVRTEQQMIDIEHALTKQGIPYKLKGRVDFLETPSSQKIIHLLKFLLEDNILSLKLLVSYDFFQFTQTEKQNILTDDKKILENILLYKNSSINLFKKIYQDKENYLSHLPEFLIEIQKLQPIDENVFLLSKKYPLAKDFLNIVLFHTESDIEIYKNKYTNEGVALITMHASKGLEYPVVFLPGIEEGFMPIREDEIESEKNLFYVALTRCKEKLYISNAMKRKIYNKFEVRKPSRFLQHFHLTHEVKKIKKKPEQLPLFQNLNKEKK